MPYDDLATRKDLRLRARLVGGAGMKTFDVLTEYLAYMAGLAVGLRTMERDATAGRELLTDLYKVMDEGEYNAFNVAVEWMIKGPQMEGAEIILKALNALSDARPEIERTVRQWHNEANN